MPCVTEKGFSIEGGQMPIFTGTALSPDNFKGSFKLNGSLGGGIIIPYGFVFAGAVLNVIIEGSVKNNITLQKSREGSLGGELTLEVTGSVAGGIIFEDKTPQSGLAKKSIKVCCFVPADLHIAQIGSANSLTEWWLELTGIGEHRNSKNIRVKDYQVSGSNTRCIQIEEA